jgi:hypothetical protein
MTANPYPGDGASPYDMNRLADFYRDAAHRSSGSIQIGDPLSAGPMRLLATHSIELNLSAYLLLHGVTWAEIPKMGHDLATRLQWRWPAKPASVLSFATRMVLDFVGTPGKQISRH